MNLRLFILSACVALAACNTRKTVPPENVSSPNTPCSAEYSDLRNDLVGRVNLANFEVHNCDSAYKLDLKEIIEKCKDKSKFVTLAQDLKSFLDQYSEHQCRGLVKKCFVEGTEQEDPNPDAKCFIDSKRSKWVDAVVDNKSLYSHLQSLQEYAAE